MNYNYKGSLAERFIQFKSGLLATADASTDLFNAFSIYVPSNLAADNLIGVSLTNIATAPVVLTVTLDNYKTVLTGDLLAQWRFIFNSDTNIDVILYIIVFEIPTLPAVFADELTVTSTGIDYAPLTAAFEHLYSISFFKTLFSPYYDGAVHTVTPGGDTYAYDDSNYFDMALALAQLCAGDLELSYCLLFTKLTLPLAAPDTNECLVMSKTRAEEIAAATAFNVVIAGVTPRNAYFWGMLNLMQAGNTWLFIHSDKTNPIPFVFGTWFGKKNDAGTYVGNKLTKMRISNTAVKPTGVPSWLNSEANENLSTVQYDILDSKFVSYFMSIADGTINDSMILRAKSVMGSPVMATQMSKWIDYNTSQFIAKYMTAAGTLTVPVLKNAETYNRILEILLGNIQTFARIGRLSDISIGAPAYSELPSSPTDIVVSQGWEAYFVDDLEKVLMTGTVVY